MVLVTVGAESFALFQDHASIHLFDSHSRDITGSVDSNGAAVLLHFSSPAQVDFMMQRYGNDDFELSPLLISQNDETSAVQQVQDCVGWDGTQIDTCISMTRPEDRKHNHCHSTSLKNVVPHCDFSNAIGSSGNFGTAANNHRAENKEKAGDVQSN